LEKEALYEAENTNTIPSLKLMTENKFGNNRPLVFPSCKRDLCCDCLVTALVLVLA
jgi:hypothetical protein